MDTKELKAEIIEAEQKIICSIDLLKRKEPVGCKISYVSLKRVKDHSTYYSNLAFPGRLKIDSTIISPIDNGSGSALTLKQAGIIAEELKKIFETNLLEVLQDLETRTGLFVDRFDLLATKGRIIDMTVEREVNYEMSRL